MIIHKRSQDVKRGHGIFDFVKPLLEATKSVVNTPGISDIIKNTITIGKNTKDIVDSIKQKASDREVEEVLAKINKLKNGRGCKCPSGKGFRYA